jgi:CspA family cold shock protein
MLREPTEALSFSATPAWGRAAKWPPYGRQPEVAGPPVRDVPVAPAAAGPALTHRRVLTMTGTIVRIVAQRGFGFIQEQDGKEVFFHASGVVGVTPFDSLQEGQPVSYEKQQDDRGRGERAVNVQPA